MDVWPSFTCLSEVPNLLPGLAVREDFYFLPSWTDRKDLVLFPLNFSRTAFLQERQWLNITKVLHSHCMLDCKVHKTRINEPQTDFWGCKEKITYGRFSPVIHSYNIYIIEHLQPVLSPEHFKEYSAVIFFKLWTKRIFASHVTHWLDRAKIYQSSYMERGL